MRELSVYYCPKCGRYGYYQLVRNAVCPDCHEKMVRLDILCHDFMRLDSRQRDDLIIRHMLASCPSADSIPDQGRPTGDRALIASLVSRIHDLETENEQLNSTVNWMHQTIWDLLAQNRELKRRCEENSYPES